MKRRARYPASKRVRSLKTQNAGGPAAFDRPGFVGGGVGVDLWGPYRGAPPTHPFSV